MRHSAKRNLMQRLSALGLGVLVLSACIPNNAPASSHLPTATPLRPIASTTPVVTSTASAQFTIQEYAVPAYPHDVAPAPDGTVWWTAQGEGALGRLNPADGKTHQIPLGQNSAPHGVIIGPDGAAWVTDGGQNALVRVDPATETVKIFPLPKERANANLNTAAFAKNGTLWFTGQNGIYGRLNPTSGELKVFDAPRGRGPYGITATPDGKMFYASLAGNHIAQIDSENDTATPFDPPTPGQGARRVWSDAQGNIWVSEWTAGQVARYTPASNQWREWKLPSAHPMVYAVYVDEQDKVWLSDWGSNALVRFDPATETFTPFPVPSATANIRQILGRKGEVWAAESGANKLIVIRMAAQ